MGLKLSPNLDIKDQVKILSQGTTEIIPENGLYEKLKASKPSKCIIFLPVSMLAMIGKSKVKETFSAYA